MMKDHQDPLVPFPSESSADVLTDVLRDGARRSRDDSEQLYSASTAVFLR